LTSPLYCHLQLVKGRLGALGALRSKLLEEASSTFPDDTQVYR
jgi:hypothetical protein